MRIARARAGSAGLIHLQSLDLLRLERAHHLGRSGLPDLAQCGVAALCDRLAGA